MLDLKSGDPEFKSLLCPPAGCEPGGIWFNSSSTLVDSQVVCLLPVGILILTCSVHLLYSVAICVVDPNSPMAATYQSTFQIKNYYNNYNHYY